jgi:succinate dehydrogenase / fumarate reductase cytochrome b subunit
VTASASTKAALTGDEARVTSPAQMRLRALFSLSGVVPLGIFLVLHLWTNAHALASDASFTRAEMPAFHLPSPALAAFEALFVLAPLLFHAAFGTWLTVTRRALSAPSVYPRGVSTMMRVTGMIALAYLAYHLYELRFAMATQGMRREELYTVLSSSLSSRALTAPLRAMFYMVGIAAITFHFAAGLWGYAVARGYARGPRARRAAAIGFGVVGAALFFVSADVVTLFATGARLVGHDDMTPLATDLTMAPSACPPPSAAAAPPASPSSPP